MERYLRVNLLGPGPRLMKKKLPGCGLTRVEKHWSTWPVEIGCKCLQLIYLVLDSIQLLVL